jgi:hypothetical protein
MTVTDHGRARFWRGRPAVAALALVAVVAVTAWRSDMARADGDPASDVLATQSLFLPQDASVPSTRQAQLISVLAAAQRGGVPLRVAVIASPTDLGSVTELWGRPQPYAKFLGAELALVYRGTLLVIMPHGFGLHSSTRASSREQSALAGLRPAGSISGLGDATLAAIVRIAAASGHPVTVPSVTGPRGGDPSQAVPWIVFAAGVLLIAAAWTVSLRAKPLGAPRRPGAHRPR